MIKEEKNNNQDEVDLRELYAELKINARLISGVTIIFVLFAIIYNFIVVQPVYQYNAFLRIPDNVSVTQINTCAEVLKNNISIEKGLVDVRRLQESFLLVCTFEDSSVEGVLNASNVVMPVIAEKANKIIYEGERQRFYNEVAKYIQEDIAMIRRTTNSDHYTVDEVNGKFQYITNRLEKMEKDYIFPETEIIQSRNIPNAPIRPNKKRTIGVSFVVGVLLSCGYVIGKYLFHR